MKLEFELVPDSCWYSNLRSALKPAEWDKIRRKAYAKANSKCMICGAYSKRLEAHERWQYDDEKLIQKLVDVVAICKRCHEVIHIGRTTLMGREKEACEHYMKVNNVSYVEYKKALSLAYAIHMERSKKEWQVDATLLPTFM